MEDVISLSDYFKFLLVLGVVIGLILLLGMLLRKFGAGFPFAMSKGRRLGVVETLPIDAKHRLVLLRRDDVEHLVIIGATTDTVVETTITPPVEEDDDDIITMESHTEKLGVQNTAGQRFKDLITSMKSK